MSEAYARRALALPSRPLALWVAAFVNPLPVLGVAPEIRGGVIEDVARGEVGLQGALERVEWAVASSIAHLRGQPVQSPPEHLTREHYEDVM